MFAFIISLCCSIVAVRSFAAHAFKKQKYLSWCFLSGVLKLALYKNLKYCRHPSVQPKKNLSGIRKRFTTRLSLCHYLWSTSAGRIVGERNWKSSSFFHSTCIFCFSFLDPKLSLALLPQSLCVLSSHMSCPALVAAAWHQHNETPAVRVLSCLWTDFFLSQGFFPHFPSNSL